VDEAHRHVVARVELLTKQRRVSTGNQKTRRGKARASISRMGQLPL